MDGKQLYTEAMNFFEGKDGFPKNEKKGYARLKEAADAGFQKAREDYAEYLWVEKDKYDAAISYYEAGRLSDNESISDYLFCLKTISDKKKKDIEFAKSCVEKAKTYEEHFNADAFYFYAELLKRAYPDKTKEVDEKLDVAAFLGSSCMPDSVYASIGRERGVLAEKFEMELWQKNAPDGKYVSFVPCRKTADDAWAIAKANLEEKNTKKILTSSQISRLLKSAVAPVLEYQPIIKCSVLANEPDFRYEYDNPKYATVSTGSNTYKVNLYWTNYCATFKTKQSQRDLWKVYKDATTTDQYVEGRVRITPSGLDDAISRVKELSTKDAIDGSRNEIKNALVSVKNWEKKYITINFNDTDISLKELSYVFIPFYFFTIKLGSKNTVTVRVDGYSGEVDYFTDNPFGQFTAEDNVALGGGASQSKSQKSGAKKNKRRNAKKGLFSNKKKIISNLIFLGQIAAAIGCFATTQYIAGGILIATIVIHFFIRKKLINR